MSEFKIIETQEQFDEAIKDRLGRVEKKWQEKYSNYLSPEDIASRTDELNARITELGNSLNAANDKASADAQTIAELNERVKVYETASVKSRIAHEIGLPNELANRISGNTEEEMKADAESLFKIVGARQNPQPMYNPERPTGDSKEAELKAMLHNLI